MASGHELVRGAPNGLLFPFLRLPLEIQHQICSLFCRHCRYRGQPSPPPSVPLGEVAGASFTTLKALSETCHALKDIAQPILYHYPDVKLYTPFFKTVTAKPALAASVKILARMYESSLSRPYPGSERFEEEDFTYLIQLGQKFELSEETDNESVDYWIRDDANFKRCFRCLTEVPNGDTSGYTMDMAWQAYSCLMTALHFAILPKLEFAMINLYDGRGTVRYLLTKSGQYLLPYPYLSKIVAVKPDHFLHLNTIVFRQAYHYRHDRLGLERLAWLLPVIPNVRVVFFKFLHGETVDEYQEPNPLPPAPELSWPALVRLEEVYFDPCVREHVSPLVAIANMLQRCPRMRKLTYRHKWPDQYDPVLFSPSELLNAIIPVKDTLLHLELYCNSARIPSFPRKSLLHAGLKEFSLLTTLILDEQLFCQHWLSDVDSGQNSCLIHILPKNISSLTVRLHDKFKATLDIVQLGHKVILGHYPQLSFLSVHIIQDMSDLDDRWVANTNPDAFDAEYLLYGIPPEQWEKTLRALADSTRLAVVEAFRNTVVAIDVKYVYERIFSYTRSPHE